MSDARYIVGHVFDVIESLPDESIDLALSSPPFFALRSYLPDDSPLKQWEIGTEPTPGEFIDTLVRLVEAITPKLAPHGSLAFELGDTYAGSGGAGGDYADDGLRAGQNRVDGSARRSRGDWAPRQPRRVMPGRKPLDKSLCLIPELFRVALVYGFNPLTGRETPQWRARNVVRWCRPNPSVGAIGDKFRTATSDMVVVCKSAQRYFDGDAVRVFDKSEGGRPRYDWWEIGTAGYEGAHFAVWPDDLCVAPIKSMTPAKVCRTCGKPQQRIVERQNESQGNTAGGKGRNGRQVADVEYSAITVGWTDCGHDDWRRGVVLDPFAGSGTTLAVATGLGRDAVGIDLDPRNSDLAVERCGMFVTVDFFTREPGQVVG